MSDKLNAKLEQMTGAAKEMAGKVLGDKSLEAEGFVDNLVGKAKEVAADVKEGLDGALDQAKDLAADAKDAAEGALNSLKNKF